MIDMKLTHEQSSPTMLSEPTENNGPAYPYGLTISLDTDSLRKLAMGLPQVGDVFELCAMVEVTSVSKDANQIEDRKNVELQITTMDLKSPEAQMNEQQAAHARLTKLYG